MPNLAQYRDMLAAMSPTAIEGQIVAVGGVTAHVAGFPAPVGSLAQIERQTGGFLEAEVVGFRDDAAVVFPLGTLEGVRQGSRVRLLKSQRAIKVGPAILGRVLDATGQFIDGGMEASLADRVALTRSPPRACDRPRIERVLSTGVRSIDGLLTVGIGQRLGIFAGSGVGKSVLLGMMARYTAADVIVIGLIGERGREVNEFLERDLGAVGRKRSVVVVATSDEPAVMRVQAALTATSIAEYFRDQGKNVLLLMDSVTRFAMAQREIGLAAGEPPATKGYPPSVFALTPRLVERAGRNPLGSITGFYSVLVEGDDTNEPVADMIRGLLDGHVLLSRSIASKGTYPAIDMLPSLSRLMSDLVTPEHRAAARAVRGLMSAYRENEDLISIGAYRMGSQPEIDLAIGFREEIQKYLRQDVEQSATFETARAELLQLGQRIQQQTRT